ncbi:hypothetical protein SUBVAR_07372 [Subdoligranulum variabile DSM 15176]|uniref:Uncharacterized protein n=1 Tax=Subdoligranulum variabile DSM 15176 TaxID=411471 RepID=D1PSI9_9FIRM|nr:hypothetical protein SUBVAR_07372 [Subdoligranulum variabile DSM 15176]
MRRYFILPSPFHSTVYNEKSSIPERYNVSIRKDCAKHIARKLQEF